MSNEEYTHQAFWEPKGWFGNIINAQLLKYHQDVEKNWAKEHDLIFAQKNNHLFWFDHKGRKIIGKEPDRTCLNCFTGFGLETISEHGLSPCCNTHNHAAVLWE